MFEVGAAAPKFSVGAAPATRLTKKELRKKKEKRDKWATHELSDVWKSLESINEAWDARALRTLDDVGDDAALADALARAALDEEVDGSITYLSKQDAADRTFAEIRVTEACFGASVLPESDLREAIGWEYRDPANPVDVASDSEDECPKIDESGGGGGDDDAPAEAGAAASELPIQLPRLGETWTPPRVRINVDEVNAERMKRSPLAKTVAEMSDLASGETFDVEKLEEVIDRQVEYPRVRTTAQDLEDEAKGREFAAEIERMKKRKELKKEKKLIRKTKQALGDLPDDDSGSDDDSDDSGDGLDVDAPPDKDAAMPRGPQPGRDELDALAWKEELSLDENLENALRRVRLQVPLGERAPEDLLGQIPNADEGDEGAAAPSLLSFLDNDARD